MLNLYNKLTEIDKKRIENYIIEFGTEDYIGNEIYLQYWNKSKKKLFHMLNGQLIYSFPFSYKKPMTQISSELNDLIRRHKLCNSFHILWENKRKEYDIDVNTWYDVWSIFHADVLIADKIPRDIKFKREDAKSTLQIPKTMKPIRAIQKIIKYFKMDELLPLYEEFRIAHSLIYNEKNVEGTLCISIHPMDFLTMSDNDMGWNSCMSWRNNGCYHVGTVEMMNSNNVVCAYIESKNSFNFSNTHQGEEYTWNNKKWRQLFYVTPDIIVAGKSYPYVNETVTQKVLKVLKDLAKTNLNWEYKYGPELYKDMVHIGSYFRMEQNKRWIRTEQTFKHNIIFDSKGMYNDMLNARDYKYWCIRNKPKKTKVISFSGKAPCACCMDDVIELDDDLYIHEEDSYNDRYRNVKNVVCESCTSECDLCGEKIAKSKMYLSSDGYRCCKECYKDYIKLCPDCGETFKPNNNIRNSEQLLVRLTEEPIWLQDIGTTNKVEAIQACPCCRDKILPKFTRQRVTADIQRHFFSWDREDEIYLSKECYTLEDDFVRKHVIENLSKPNID